MLFRSPNTILWNPIKTGFEPPQKLWMEDKTIQDMINESKKKLVQAQIVDKSILTQKIIPSHAYEENNIDWRLLSLAQILK